MTPIGALTADVSWQHRLSIDQSFVVGSRVSVSPGEESVYPAAQFGSILDPKTPHRSLHHIPADIGRPHFVLLGYIAPVIHILKLCEQCRN